MLILYSLLVFCKKVAIMPYRAGHVEYLTPELTFSQKFRGKIPLWTMEFNGSLFRLRSGRHYLRGGRNGFVKMADGGKDLERLDHEELVRSIERMIRDKRGFDNDFSSDSGFDESDMDNQTGSNSRNNDSRYSDGRSNTNNNRNRSYEGGSRNGSQGGSRNDSQGGSRNGSQGGRSNPRMSGNRNSGQRTSNNPVVVDTSRSGLTDAGNKGINEAVEKLVGKNDNKNDNENDKSSKISNTTSKLASTEKSTKNHQNSNKLNSSKKLKAKSEAHKKKAEEGVFGSLKAMISRNFLPSNEGQKSNLLSRQVDSGYAEDFGDGSTIGFDFTIYPIFVNKINKKNIILYRGRCMNHNMKLEPCSFEDWWDLDSKFYWSIFALGDVDNIELIRKAVDDIEVKNYRFHQKNRVNLESCRSIPYETSSDGEFGAKRGLQELNENPQFGRNQINYSGRMGSISLDAGAMGRGLVSEIERSLNSP